MAQLLIDKEVIFAEDVEKIFGKRPWASRSEEIMAAETTAESNSEENTAQPQETKVSETETTSASEEKQQ